MENFRFVCDYRVRAADINYGGHLSNSAVLDIFQDARIAYLAALGPYGELDIEGFGIIMPESHVYYHGEMFLHQDLRVGVRCSAVGRSSFTLEYRIEREGVPTAEGNTPLICFNYEQRKSVRLPAGFSAALRAFETLRD
jgi:acyl-CoA thioesterase FadM